jgi:hypothetical protein
MSRSRGASPEASESSFLNWAVSIAVIIAALAVLAAVFAANGGGGVRVTGPASGCVRPRCSGAPHSVERPGR